MNHEKWGRFLERLDRFATVTVAWMLGLSLWLGGTALVYGVLSLVGAPEWLAVMVAMIVMASAGLGAISANLDPFDPV